MNLNSLINATRRAVHDHSPSILTAMGVSGVVTTAYLTHQATWSAYEIIAHDESITGAEEDPKTRLKNRARLVWRMYIPPVISGTATIVCIVTASRIEHRRVAAATAAYSLTERAFSEYKDKVVDKFGATKEQQVRDEVAADRMNANPPANTGVIVTGQGNVLCCELYTGRYFESDMEKLRRAQNDINAKLLKHDYCHLADFYYILGIPYTSNSHEVGWESSRQMELEFTTAMSDDGRPCIAFEYNYVKPL